jgi:hypothetical protein
MDATVVSLVAAGFGTSFVLTRGCKIITGGVKFNQETARESALKNEARLLLLGRFGLRRILF